MICADPLSYFLGGMVFGIGALAVLFVVLVALALRVAAHNARRLLG